MSVTLIREALVKTLPAARPRLPFGLPSPQWLSFPVFAACVLACFVYLVVPGAMADPDIWWHLRDAEWQVAHHAFLHRDLYSFTAQGAPWMNHEWLAELPFYLGWRMLGSQGVYLVTLVAIECILLCVFYRAYQCSRSVPASFIASVAAAILATVSFGPRTLLFGWICLVIELIVIERFDAEGRGLWILPPLFLFWVNLHGSWVIGLVLFAGFLACQYARPTSNGVRLVSTARCNASASYATPACSAWPPSSSILTDGVLSSTLSISPSARSSTSPTSRSGRRSTSTPPAVASCSSRSQSSFLCRSGGRTSGGCTTSSSSAYRHLRLVYLLAFPLPRGHPRHAPSREKCRTRHLQDQGGEISPGSISSSS